MEISQTQPNLPEHVGFGSVSIAFWLGWIELIMSGCVGNLESRKGHGYFLLS